METERLIRSVHVKEANTLDGVVLLDVQRGKTYPLNPTETLIWQQLGEGATLAQIAENVATACHVSLEVVTTDVQEFTNELLDAGLLSPGTPAAKSPRQTWFLAFLERIRPRGRRTLQND